MLYAFIDESYSKDLYYVGAFVVEEEHLNAVSAALRAASQYAAGFGVPVNAEFHAHEIMSGRGDWKPIARSHRAAVAIYRKALLELVQVPTARMVIRGVNVDLLKTSVTATPNHPT